jgi:DNA-binding transcriptional MerR regulator
MAEVENEHWTTSQVAKELGVSPSLVRTWIAYMAWEVRRNAEGHRVFSHGDVEQLKSLKAWLDEGHSLKEFRRERQIEGPFDPRLELRGAYKRLKEIQSQEEALIAKQHELMALAAAQRQALAAQLEEVRRAAEGEPAQAPETSALVQGVLKQLLTSLLERQGKLQLVRRFEEGGKVRLEYAAPNGKHQVIDDLLATEADQRLMETVLGLILNG